MLKGFKLVATAAITIALFSNVATAAIPLYNGWYVEGNAGASKATNLHYPGSTDSKGFGWNATAGYRFTQFVAIDVAYTHYAETRIKIPTGPVVATTTQSSYDIAAKLILPVAKTGLEIFGKGGIGRINTYTHVNAAASATTYGYMFNTGVHTHTVPVYGVGAEYGILPNVLVNAQWMQARGTHSISTQNLFSLGAAYVF